MSEEVNKKDRRDREEQVVDTELYNEWINSFSGLGGRGSIRTSEPKVVTLEELKERFCIK